MCTITIRSDLFDELNFLSLAICASGIGTRTIMLPKFQRASPSTSLDMKYLILLLNFTRI